MVGSPWTPKKLAVVDSITPAYCRWTYPTRTCCNTVRSGCMHTTVDNSADNSAARWISVRWLAHDGAAVRGRHSATRMVPPLRCEFTRRTLHRRISLVQSDLQRATIRALRAEPCNWLAIAVVARVPPLSAQNSLSILRISSIFVCLRAQVQAAAFMIISIYQGLWSSENKSLMGMNCERTERTRSPALTKECSRDEVLVMPSQTWRGTVAG